MNEFYCPECDHRMRYPDERAGKRIRCKDCKQPIQLPELDGESAPVATNLIPKTRGEALAFLFNSYAEKAKAEHPDDEAAATEALARTMEYIATGSRCQSCYTPAPVRSVSFHEHIGMIVMFQHKSIKGRLCRKCADRHFTEFTFTTFFLGWWGCISACVTPLVLINNFVRYVPCLFMPDELDVRQQPAGRLKIAIALTLGATPLIVLFGFPPLITLLNHL